MGFILCNFFIYFRVVYQKISWKNLNFAINFNYNKVINLKDFNLNATDFLSSKTNKNCKFD